MKYCYECGEKLVDRELEGEGIIPYCPRCGEYRFPIFSTAVSMIVENPKRDKILLIKQYGRDSYILVAGYINKGESAEDAVRREVMEEIGIGLTEIQFNKSEYFAKSNTLMINFVCVADSEDLSAVSPKEIDEATWFSREDALKNIRPGSLAKRFLCSACTVDSRRSACGSVTLHPKRAL